MTAKRLAGLLRSRPAVGIAGAAVVVGVLGTSTALANHDAKTIHACVNTQNGSIRIVNAASDCAQNETDRHGQGLVPQHSGLLRR